ncbi:MAG: YihY/virulence factor BrkB family protein [Microthrixaceae bacterium]|nr:YihY/virulence factor BrkB family protein [Microthrixaceae bacterium]
MPPALQRIRSRLERRQWWQVATSIAHGASEDQVTGLAAEMAFFGMLSLFPLTIAIAAGVGFLEPVVGTDAADQVRSEVVAALSTGLGSQASGVTDAIEELFADTRPGVFTVGLLVALWSASRGFRSTVRSIDAVYHLEQRRTYLELRLLSLAMAVVTVPLAALGLVVFAVGPLLGGGAEAAEVFGSAQGYEQAWRVLRWPVGIVVVCVAVTTVLHIAPDERTPWRSDVPGSLVAIVSWALSTVALRVYLRFGGSENLLIGSLGAVLVVLIWLYLLALGLLLGAELNAVLARRSGTPREARSALEFETLARRMKRLGRR